MPRESRPAPHSKLRAAALRAAVHWDALRADPALYARCMRWRATGKRLRARMHLAPLLARSAKAYELWQVLHESRFAEATAHSGGAPKIVALVADGAENERTLASLEREGIDAHFVSGSGAIELSEGVQWVMPLASGDILGVGAGDIYRSAAARASSDVHVIYADDDLIDRAEKRSSPHLKPDWNGELMRHHDYVSGASIFRVCEPGDLGGEDWIARLTLRAIEAGAQPLHLRHVLHHRRTRPAPVVPASTIAPVSEDESLPSVSIIVPTRNRLDLLRTCLEGVASTHYPEQPEVIVIDNGSDDPQCLAYLAGLDPAFATVLRDDGPFNFASLNNRAAAKASGELLCFLNNDIEMTDPLWLVAMARQAMREEVGTVGARLLYPDRTIQHAGVNVGIGGAAAHAHRGLAPEEEGYFHRHSLPQFVSAVTAACMVVRRDRFERIGGFDAERFAVSFNDVDLCLRLRGRGWQSLYEPRATLVHHESVSRGLDRDPVGAARQAREVAALQERWQTGLAASADLGEGAAPDPFHHPGLSPLSERFVLRL